ncbi:hypothetical protein ANANG_G00132260 [Anguilla anguilla]|uniref:Uncharacterized protein n=1 Tax=Anguilla anguilla TaxID=7936 RepID=A0A9D3MG18_ANGAN|nr:hypothetical protein ANANG_G00132260 [Anguilla anguilla]
MIGGRSTAGCEPRRWSPLVAGGHDSLLPFSLPIRDPGGCAQSKVWSRLFDYEGTRVGPYCASPSCTLSVAFMK